MPVPPRNSFPAQGKNSQALSVVLLRTRLRVALLQVRSPSGPLSCIRLGETLSKGYSNPLRLSWRFTSAVRHGRMWEMTLSFHIPLSYSEKAENFSTLSPTTDIGRL